MKRTNHRKLAASSATVHRAIQAVNETLKRVAEGKAIHDDSCLLMQIEFDVRRGGLTPGEVQAQ